MQWELLKFDGHRLLKDCVRDLNHLLRSQPALYEQQFSIGGFEWLDLSRRHESVISYRRKGNDPDEDLLVILNLTPVVRQNWKVHTYGKSEWKEIFNSDYKKYWGTGDTLNTDIQTTLVNKNDSLYEINLHLPPLGALVLK